MSRRGVTTTDDDDDSVEYELNTDRVTSLDDDELDQLLENKEKGVSKYLKKSDLTSVLKKDNKYKAQEYNDMMKKDPTILNEVKTYALSSITNTYDRKLPLHKIIASYENYKKMYDELLLGEKDLEMVKNSISKPINTKVLSDVNLIETLDSSDLSETDKILTFISVVVNDGINLKDEGNDEVDSDDEDYDLDDEDDDSVLRWLNDKMKLSSKDTIVNTITNFFEKNTINNKLLFKNEGKEYKVFDSKQYLKALNKVSEEMLDMKRIYSEIKALEGRLESEIQNSSESDNARYRLGAQQATRLKVEDLIVETSDGLYKRLKQSLFAKANELERVARSVKSQNDKEYINATASRIRNFNIDLNKSVPSTDLTNKILGSLFLYYLRISIHIGISDRLNNGTLTIDYLFNMNRLFDKVSVALESSIFPKTLQETGRMVKNENGNKVKEKKLLFEILKDSVLKTFYTFKVIYYGSVYINKNEKGKLSSVVDDVMESIKSNVKKVYKPQIKAIKSETENLKEIINDKYMAKAIAARRVFNTYQNEFNSEIKGMKEEQSKRIEEIENKRSSIIKRLQEQIKSIKKVIESSYNISIVDLKNVNTEKTKDEEVVEIINTVKDIISGINLERLEYDMVVKINERKENEEDENEDEEEEDENNEDDDGKLFSERVDTTDEIDDLIAENLNRYTDDFLNSYKTYKFYIGVLNGDEDAKAKASEIYIKSVSVVKPKKGVNGKEFNQNDVETYDVDYIFNEFDMNDEKTREKFKVASDTKFLLEYMYTSIEYFEKGILSDEQLYLKKRNLKSMPKKLDELQDFYTNKFEKEVTNWTKKMEALSTGGNETKFEENAIPDVLVLKLLSDQNKLKDTIGIETLPIPPGADLKKLYDTLNTEQSKLLEASDSMGKSNKKLVYLFQNKLVKLGSRIRKAISDKDFYNNYDKIIKRERDSISKNKPTDEDTKKFMDKFTKIELIVKDQFVRLNDLIVIDTDNKLIKAAVMKKDYKKLKKHVSKTQNGSDKELPPVLNVVYTDDSSKKVYKPLVNASYIDTMKSILRSYKLVK